MFIISNKLVKITVNASNMNSNYLPVKMYLIYNIVVQ